MGGWIMRCAVAVALVVPGPVLAEPPPGIVPDAATKEWYLNLRSREGWACCDISHCRPAAIAPNDDGRVFAFIDKESFGPTAPNEWREVPLHELRVRGNRPGKVRGAIVCFADNRVICVDLEPAT
ncbi:MAG: hypothetical protein IT555_00470 [Acetobacteraceae bacterium]|nr:hypothetical protein [Acetobacteraceae bacterium]